MIIVGILLLVVSILLFGAGAVRNFVGLVLNGILLLAGVGFLAYGLEWDAYTVKIAAGVLIALGVWAAFEIRKQG